jgi:hypothetical protein
MVANAINIIGVIIQQPAGVMFEMVIIPWLG